MIIEMAQITTDAGNIDQNVVKIVRTIEQARDKGADLVVFPELTIPGYSAMDLFERRRFLEANKQALTEVANHTHGIGVLVGFADYDRSVTRPDGSWLKHNAAALLNEGRIKQIVHKSLLPDYDVFDEDRHFASGVNRKTINFRGQELGVQICEDSWDEKYQTHVSDELTLLGADVLINLSASPFYVGKRTAREAVIQRIVQKHKIPFIYTNLVGGQDGYDGELVFDGQSMAFNARGDLIALGKPFQEQLITVNLEQDQPALEAPKFQPTKELHDALVFGIREYYRRTGQKTAHIGLSGGIDSALVAALATEALGAENVYGYTMPSIFSSWGSVEDSRALARNLGCNFEIIPIGGIFDAYDGSLAPGFMGLEQDVTEENIQARIRGNILMAKSNKLGGLVLSTGNKTETALGYTTLYGDMAGGLAVISDVSKLKVYELANYINERAGREVIPYNTIQKPPSAELRPDQTDEQSLGIPYTILSPLVDAMIEQDLALDELAQQFPEKYVYQVDRLIRNAEYKRRQAPPGIKVTPKSFGIGRRIPLGYSFRG